MNCNAILLELPGQSQAGHNGEGLLALYLGLKWVYVEWASEVFIEDSQSKKKNFLAQTFKQLFKLNKQGNILSPDPLESVLLIMVFNFIADRHKLL